jgi:outer membrane receptor for ferrienterochelin and colicins
MTIWTPRLAGRLDPARPIDDTSGVRARGLTKELLTALFFAAAFAPRLAFAQDAAGAGAPKDAKDADTVVVTGTRTPERVQRATVKTDVITREEADRRGATTVADALASQPGLVVNPGSYGFLGGVSAVQIQGFDRDRVLILEDGERVVGDVGGAIDLAAIPTADLERIEVVFGPSSSLYGSAALGGVVNILTAPPRREGPSGRVRLEGRSYRGLVAQANGAYASRKNAPWIGLDLNYTRQDGLLRFEDGRPDLRLPETSRRMIGLRAGTSLTPDMDVRVRARAFRDRLDGLESQTAPGLGRFLVDLPEQTDRYTLHVIHVTRFGKGSSLRLTLGRQQFDNFTSKDRRDSPIDERRDRTQRMQSFEGVLTVADGPRTWVGGTRFEAEHFEQTLTKTESSSRGPVTASGPEVPPLAYGIAAAYAQLSWKFGALTVMPGVRVEGHTRYGESVAPRLAAAWSPSPALTFRTSAGRGFRAPSAKELGFVFDHSFYGYRITGNAALVPETSWGVNADVAWAPTSAVSTRASVYGNWVDQLIDLDLANGSVTNGVASYTYKNFGRARTAGGQVDARFKPAPWLTAETSYAYTWTRDDVNDQPLQGRPPHSVTSSLRVDAPWKLELYARARVVTSAFLSEELRAPGYQTVDVRVGRALWPSAQAYVGALNVLDVRQEPGRIGDTRSPLGRVLYVGMKADLPWETE